MSKVIDEKVVEMRFDNAHFEKNVQGTLSTLDKLKAKLNLSGASKGLENINNISNKINFSGMSDALDSIRVKFSALDVIGVTTLTNITNRAINAGTALLKSMSVDQLSAGWKKYDMQTGNVQTLVNTTGKTVEEIENYLDKLMWYSDETSYGFTDMTAALAQMSSSGGDIEKLIPMIMGVANATAFAGKGAAEFSRVMYNLNQSYGTGAMTYIDWRSIEQAGVGSNKVLKQTLIDTAVELGKIKEGMVDIGTFSSTLKDKWLDKEVMEAGFKKFSVAFEEAMKLVDSGEVDTISAAFEKLEGQVDSLSLTASKSAQEAKTFSEVIEYTKDAVSSNWMQIWKAIFGNYEQAKKMWTELADAIYTHFVTPLEKLRDITKAVMTYNPFTVLMDKLENSGIGQIAKKIDKVSKSLEYYQDMVNQVWRGNYKNQPYRKGLLENEGHNYEVIQSLVNKGYQYKLTIDDITTAEKEYGAILEETTEQLEELSDEKLREIGLTEDEIKMYRALEKEAKKRNKTISELIDSMKDMDGRTLLINSFKNFGSAVISIFESIKKAWRDVFHPGEDDTEFMQSVVLKIYNLISAFNKFSEVIKNRVQNNADKLVRTLRGLWSVIHIITQVVGGGLKIAFNILKTILSAFNISVLDFTAMLGDVLYNIDQFITKNNIVVKAIQFLIDLVIRLVAQTKEWIKNNEKIMFVVNKIKDAFQSIGDATKAWIDGLKETDNIPKYIFEGLINGIKSNGPKVFDVIKNIAIGLIEAFKSVLGIHSPSTIFFEIGTNIWQGLINGIKSGWTFITNMLQNMGEGIGNFFSNIDFGKVLAVGIGGGLIYTVKEVTGFLNNLTKPLEGLSNLFTGIGSALSKLGAAAYNFTEVMEKNAIANIIKQIGIGLAILAASVYFLSKIEPGRLWSTIGAVAALAIILGALAIAITRFSKSIDTLSISMKDIAKITLAIAGIAIGIWLMSKALLTISKIDGDKLFGSFMVLIGILAGLGAFIIAINKFGGVVTENLGNSFNGIGKMIRKIATALLIMVLVIKLAGLIKPHDIEMAIAVVSMFGIFVAGLMVISIFGKNADKAGKMIWKVAAALLIMVAVFKIAGLLNQHDIENGIVVLAIFSKFCMGLIAVSFLAGKNAAKAGLMLLEIASALLLMVIVFKIAGGLKEDDIYKGIGVLLAFGVFMSLLIAVSFLAGKNAIQAGLMLMAVASSMVILAGVLFVLGEMDGGKLIKATGIISIIGFVFALLIRVSEYAKGATKTIYAITVSLAILVGAVMLLTLLDPESLLKSTAALSSLMFSFAAIMYAMKNVKIEKGFFKTLGSLLLIMGVLSLILLALSFLPMNDVNTLVTKALALSTLMLGLAGMMGALAFVAKIKYDKRNMNKLIEAMYLLTPVIAVLGLVLGIMTGIGGNAGQMVGSAIAITILLGAMTGVLFVINKIGDMKLTNIAKGVGGLLALSGIVLILGEVLKGLKDLQPQQAIGVVTALSVLLLVMTGVLALVSLIGMIGIDKVFTGVFALTVLSAVVLILAEIFIGISKLNSEVMLTQAIALSTLLLALSVAVGILALAGLGGPAALIGVGSLIVLIVAVGALMAAVGKLMTDIPQLEEFVTKAIPLLGKVGEGLGQFIGGIANGIITKVADSLPHLGEMLSSFMIKALPFITGMRLVDGAVLQGVSFLTLAILELSAANVIETITRFITFGRSFADLGAQLSEFYKGAESFLTGMSNIDPKIFDGIKALSSAVLELTAGELLDAISQKLLGGDANKLEKFGEQLGTLGKSLKEFADGLGGTFTQEQVDTIKCASEAIKALAEAAKAVPGTGGFLQDLLGETDLTNFANQMPKLGMGLMLFIGAIGGGKAFGKAQQDTITCAANAIKSLAEAAKAIPNTGGFLQQLIGSSDLSNFATEMPNLGAGIKGFMDKINENGGFKSEQINSVNSAVEVMKILTTLAEKKVNKDTGKKLVEFSDSLSSFGDDLKTFMGGLATISETDLNNAKNNVNGVNDMLNTILAIDRNGLSEFGDTLVKLGETSFNDFVKTFGSEQPKKDMKEAILALVDVIIKTLEENHDRMKYNFKAMGEAAINGIYESDFETKVKNAGRHFVQGFADGITKNTKLARIAATTLGDKTVTALQQSIDSHSPSKETLKLGDYFGLGFINGIRQYITSAYGESSELGNAARLGLTKAISRISDIIDSDIDSQPTIRPVLDLSDVENGVGTLNSMFGTPTVGIMSNLNAISSGMNERSQNGGEVINAINKLRKDLGNISNGDTYNINGVTYDNGSELQEAVSTLVRAARIERRV